MVSSDLILFHPSLSLPLFFSCITQISPSLTPLSPSLSLPLSLSYIHTPTLIITLNYYAIIYPIEEVLYLSIFVCISPSSAHSPAFKASVNCLTYFRIVWANITVTRKSTVLISIVTGVAEGDATLCITLSLWSWPVIKIKGVIVM